MAKIIKSPGRVRIESIRNPSHGEFNTALSDGSRTSTIHEKKNIREIKLSRSAKPPAAK